MYGPSGSGNQLVQAVSKVSWFCINTRIHQIFPIEQPGIAIWGGTCGTACSFARMKRDGAIRWEAAAASRVRFCATAA